MSVVVCSFAGWFQLRLATNPDPPTDERRGISGYTFALPGEPDLDRVLRTSNPVAPRSHGPAIGLAIRRVTVDGVSVPAHPVNGARVDLLAEPRFEGVNEVIMEQGEEPLEPFELQLAKGGFVLRRRAFLDPADPAATVYTVSRAILEPRRAKATYGTEIMQEALGETDPVAFRRHRLELVAAELATTDDPVQRAALARRVAELEHDDPSDRRVASMYFIETRHYDLNGPTTLEDPDGWLPALDTFTTFGCDIVMGAWDADALSGYAAGTLTLTTH